MLGAHARSERPIVRPAGEAVPRRLSARRNLLYRRADARTFRRFLCLLLFFMALALPNVLLSAHLGEAGAQLLKLQNELALLQKENRRLEEELIRLRSPERIEEAALALGMVSPGRTATVAVASEARHRTAQASTAGGEPFRGPVRGEEERVEAVSVTLPLPAERRGGEAGPADEESWSEKLFAWLLEGHEARAHDRR